MINVASTRAALKAIKGNFVVLPAAQVDDLLSEVERGQQARIALGNLNRAVSPAAPMSAAA